MKNNRIAACTVARKYGVWFLFGIGLYLYLHLFKDALIDDAFITLRYVKTLLASGTWGFFPGEVSNSATSPLNVLLLTLVSLFTGPTVEAALWLYGICLFCAAGMLVRLSLQITGSGAYGWLATSALVLNPLLISTIGIESIVFSALFVAALYGYQNKKWIGLGLLLGLLTLARAEGGLFFLVFMGFIPGARSKVHTLAAYILCIVPWYLFSWIHLGSFLPDTFFIKTQETWPWDFFNGITNLYLSIYPLKTILSFIFFPLAIFLVNQKIRETRLLTIMALAGLIHFLAYAILHVPPFHWYYAPEAIVIIVLGSLALGKAYRSSTCLWQRRALGLITAFYFLAPALGLFYVLAQDNFVVREMPIHSNWATHEEYKEIGLWLKENYGKDPIRLEMGEIGTLAYYCDCRLIDWFSDRTWLREYIDKHSQDAGSVSALLRINFAFYSQPTVSCCVYNLKSYSTGPSADVIVIKEWTVFTNWAGHVLIVFSRQR